MQGNPLNNSQTQVEISSQNAVAEGLVVGFVQPEHRKYVNWSPTPA
jgi:hypothetical protein